MTEGSERSDADLIASYLNGDEGAFNELYYRYRKVLYGYLHNMLPGNSSEVDDVFEESWLRVIDKLPRYRDDGKFSAWLFRLARNIFIDRLRRNRPEIFTSIDAEDTPEIGGDTELSPDREVGAEDMGIMIRKALAELPEDQREVFLLREEDMSFKDIAAVQGCSLNTVLSRMRYAVKNLRNFLLSIDNGGMIK